MSIVEVIVHGEINVVQCNLPSFTMEDYTKYDIQCNMVFNATMVTFWMSLVMNEWTNIVMDDG